MNGEKFHNSKCKDDCELELSKYFMYIGKWALRNIKIKRDTKDSEYLAKIYYGKLWKEKNVVEIKRLEFIRASILYSVHVQNRSKNRHASYQESPFYFMTLQKLVLLIS